jgi:hypothetical protein
MGPLDTCTEFPFQENHKNSAQNNSANAAASRPVAEFPKRFSSWEQALSYAGVVSQEYSR